MIINQAYVLQSVTLLVNPALDLDLVNACSAMMAITMQLDTAYSVKVHAKLV